MIMFICVFLNIFYAIMDRFYIIIVVDGADDIPQFNLKRKLKPYLGWISFINWDEDYEMEDDRELPPS